MQTLVNNILYNYSYITIFALTTLYFIVLYFILGALFSASCKQLYKWGYLQQITPNRSSKSILQKEKLYSMQSIFIFGLSSIPVIYLFRNGHIQLLEDSLLNIAGGLILLNLWNEVHFFLVHRMMHLPFFMKRVHRVHHLSKVPNVYSVYSFHWFEAVLLSTVPLTIVPFIAFSPLAILLYPLSSILLNFAGHSNYRFGNGNLPLWQSLSTRHFKHHYNFGKTYGFATHILDKIFSKKTNK